MKKESVPRKCVSMKSITFSEDCPSEMCNLNLESKLSELTEHMARDLNAQKDQIFLKRLEELGIHFDIDQEQKNRFKSFYTEISEGKETIYYNNGSEQGLRVITFNQATSPMIRDQDSKSLEISCEIRYY